jgi:leader peptidase (prepilin peptidase)/N-methyltransferase
MVFFYYFLPGILAGLLVDLAARRLSDPNSLSDAAEPGGAEEEASADTTDTLAGQAAPLSALGGATWHRAALVLVTALLIGAVGLRYNDPTQAVIVATYAAVLLACTATDLISFRIPNAITYPAIALALAAAALMPEGDLRATVAGGAAAGGFMLVAAIISRGGVGLGDVKLAAFVGLALGIRLVYPALFIMAVLGALGAAALLLLRLRGPNDPIPYAPVLAAAALAVLLWQGNAYVTL